MKPHDESAIERIVVGNNYVSAAALLEAKTFRDRHHPDKDLAEVLFLKGHLTRARLALVRRLVKMNRRGDSASFQRSRIPGALPVKPPRAGVHPGTTRATPQTKRQDANGSGVRRRTTDPQQPSEARTELKVSTGKAPKIERASAKLKGPKALTHCGRYELVEKVARGGMGVIYRARHPDLEKDFALKVLIEGADAAEEALERFRREAKAAARLDHPGIVRVYDTGTEGSFPYIVMDFIEGQSLDDLLEQEGVTPRRAAQIAIALSEALHHAHGQGLVHRDMKPGNVLLDSEGRVKITDFGIVKELSGDSKLTRTGFTLGSPCYMSPEQAVGDHELVKASSDVYSAGATLYEMLCGQPPFNGDSIHAIMNKVVEDDPEPPRKINPAIPLDLECICLKALEKEIDLRYPSAADLAADLKAFLNGEAVTAKPAGLWTRARRLARRNKLAVALSALLILTILGSIGAFVGVRIKEAQERKERARILAEEARLALRSITKDSTEIEVQRAYFAAIIKFGSALLHNPGAEEVRSERSAATLALGDRLVESGESLFAEFVYRLNEGAVLDAALENKLDAARKATVFKIAEKQASRGDLDAAVESYRIGVMNLKLAGYNTGYFDKRVRSLEELARKKSRKRERTALIESAGQRLEEGDLPRALSQYTAAIKYGDPDGSLTAKADTIRNDLIARIREALKEARGQRERFIAARDRGGFDTRYNSKLQDFLDKGDRIDREARQHLDAERYAQALASARDLGWPFLEGTKLAEAGVAKRSIERLAMRADEVSAARLATTEATKARTHKQQGDTKFANGDYAGALIEYENAHEKYQLAIGLSEGKGTVAVARANAQRQRNRARAALPSELFPKVFKRAGQAEKRAYDHYVEGALELSEEEYNNAAKLYAEAFKIAKAIEDAVDAKKRALAGRASAQREWGQLYGGLSYKNAEAYLARGESELKGEDFTQASRLFLAAANSFRQATDKAAPTARQRRRAEEQFKVMETARQFAERDNKTETNAFRRGEDLRAEGERSREKGRWTKAAGSWRRATTAYNNARDIG